MILIKPLSGEAIDLIRGTPCGGKTLLHMLCSLLQINVCINVTNEFYCNGVSKEKPLQKVTSHVPVYLYAAIRATNSTNI